LAEDDHYVCIDEGAAGAGDARYMLDFIHGAKGNRGGGRT
jgi:hypothetical protein